MKREILINQGQEDMYICTTQMAKVNTYKSNHECQLLGIDANILKAL